MSIERSNHEAAPAAASMPGSRKAGGIDWEDLFENPDNGLINAVQRAHSVDAVRRTAGSIVASLFARADDAPRREAFERLLEEMTDVSTVTDERYDPLEVVQIRTIKLLRGVKRDRVERAARAANAAGEGAERRAKTPEVLELAMQDDAMLSRPADGTGHLADDVGLTLEAAFSRVFSDALKERFAVLRGDMEAKDQIKGRLPFLFSRRFAERYVRLVQRHVLPGVFVRCRQMLSHLENLPQEAWYDCIYERFSDPSNRITLWEAWQSTWLDRTAHSKSAADVWGEFTAFSDAFHAPMNDDNRLLMEIFGRSARGLSEQITALLEIASRDASASKLFDSYQRGKAIDVALLAACYQYPLVFLEGERPMLKELVRNFGRRQRLEELPLTSRYLGDRM